VPGGYVTDSRCRQPGEVEAWCLWRTARLNTSRIYNQGVIASGLAALVRLPSGPIFLFDLSISRHIIQYKATGSTNTTLLDQAEITLDATISSLTTNGILRESCDDTKKSSCTNDQVCRLSSVVLRLPLPSSPATITQLLNISLRS
jgi:hypothetical protein